MAIKYLDSRRISGLSTETNPTPTFEDNFSTDTNWTKTGTLIDVEPTTNKRLDFTASTNGAIHGEVWDLGSTLSNSNWILRYKLNLTTVSNSGDANTKRFWFGLDSTSEMDSTITGHYFTGMYLQKNNSGEYIRLTTRENANLDDSLGTATSVSLSSNTQYWIEIKRISSTSVTLSVYSDSDYSTLVNSVSRTLTNMNNLQYLKAVNSKISTPSTATLTGFIDDVKLYDGVTSVTTNYKPKQPLSLSGCKAYYNFEQTSGSLTNIATTANGFDDGLGSSADGTNNGATTGATGKVGSYAWDFTGASDYVTIGDTSTWKFLHDETTPYTISLWVKRSGTQANNEPALLDTQGATASNVGLCLFFDTSNNLYYFISDGTGTDSKSSSAITTSTTDFDHLVFVQDWTNLTIYKNGSSIQTIDMTSFSGSTGNSAYALNIARNPRVNSYANFYLDELAIFSRALTSSEVSALYNGGTGVAVNDSSITAKPETNSIFIETDSARRWWFDGTYWNMQPTFEDNFSTDKGWVSQDTTNIKYDGVNKYFYFNLTRDNTNNASHYDLGAGNVSNTAWVLRGKLRYTTFTNGFHNNFYIGLSDKPSTTTQQQTGDFIGLCFRAESASHLFIANDSDNDFLYTQDGTASVTWSNATDYYWEIKRTSATTYTVTVRTGSHSGTIHVTLNGTCASTTQDLRYIRFSDVPDGAGGSGTTGYVDDLEFYNGVTSVQE